MKEWLEKEIEKTESLGDMTALAPVIRVGN